MLNRALGLYQDLRPIKLGNRAGIGYDFLTAAFTLDNAIHALDITSKVPANAKVVFAAVILTGGATPGHVYFSPHSDDNYTLSYVAFAAGQTIAFDMIIFPNQSGNIYYLASAADMALLTLTIKGYLI